MKTLREPRQEQQRLRRATLFPTSPVGAFAIKRDASSAATGRHPSAWLANLAQRTGTAIILIPAVIIVVWFGGWVTLTAITLIALQATRELSAMFAREGWQPLIPLSMALCLVFFLAALRADARLPLLAFGISATVLGSFAWLLLTRSPIDRTILDWALTLAIPFYIGWPLAFLLALRGDTVGSMARGFWWTMLVILAVWANDTAALLSGHYFGRNGRHKLATHISPNKTWEGFAGGMVCSTVVVFAVSIMADNILAHPISLPWYHRIILGILISLAATVGDLAKSMLKRGTGVKDSGRILPGHGGILDRIDSLLFAVFVMFAYAVSFGLV